MKNTTAMKNEIREKFIEKYNNGEWEDAIALEKEYDRIERIENMMEAKETVNYKEMESEELISICWKNDTARYENDDCAKRFWGAMKEICSRGLYEEVEIELEAEEYIFCLKPEWEFVEYRFSTEDYEDHPVFTNGKETVNL